MFYSICQIKYWQSLLFRKKIIQARKFMSFSLKTNRKLTLFPINVSLKILEKGLPSSFWTPWSHTRARPLLSIVPARI
jgi:hypothetical protein